LPATLGFITQEFSNLHPWVMKLWTFFIQHPATLSKKYRQYFVMVTKFNLFVKQKSIPKLLAQDLHPSNLIQQLHQQVTSLSLPHNLINQIPKEVNERKEEKTISIYRDELKRVWLRRK
jgi:hypothetical protein